MTKRSLPADAAPSATKQVLLPTMDSILDGRSLPSEAEQHHSIIHLFLSKENQLTDVFLKGKQFCNVTFLHSDRCRKVHRLHAQAAFEQIRPRAGEYISDVYLHACLPRRSGFGVFAS